MGRAARGRSSPGRAPRTCAAGMLRPGLRPCALWVSARLSCTRGCRSPSGPSLQHGHCARQREVPGPTGSGSCKAAPAAGPAPGPPPLRLRRGRRHAPTSAGRAAAPAPRCPAEACAGCTPAAESACESAPPDVAAAASGLQLGTGAGSGEAPEGRGRERAGRIAASKARVCSPRPTG